GPFFRSFPNLLELKNTNQVIKTNARNCTILPNFVGMKFAVHNGKNYIPIQVTESMIDYKFGFFVPTRKKFSYR
ncbi:ribosomal protein S19, partial [Wallemia mellicola CBS 633.66]